MTSRYKWQAITILDNDVTLNELISLIDVRRFRRKHVVKGKYGERDKTDLINKYVMPYILHKYDVEAIKLIRVINLR